MTSTRKRKPCLATTSSAIVKIPKRIRSASEVRIMRSHNDAISVENCIDLAATNNVQYPISQRMKALGVLCCPQKPKENCYKVKSERKKIECWFRWQHNCVEWFKNFQIAFIYEYAPAVGLCANCWRPFIGVSAYHWPAAGILRSQSAASWHHLDLRDTALHYVTVFY